MHDSGGWVTEVEQDFATSSMSLYTVWLAGSPIPMNAVVASKKSVFIS